MLFTRLLLGAAALLGALTRASPIGHKRATSAGSKTVVDAHGVYMRATHLDDGSILGAYAVGTGPSHHLAAVRSDDDGATWTQIGSIVTANSDTTNLDNADVVNLGGGTVLAAFRNHDLVNGKPTYYRITVCVSTDNGATWNFLSQADERAAADNNGLWEPFLRVAGDGSVQIYYSSETENQSNDQDNVMRHSSDGGKTWSGIVPVSGQGITSRDGMTGVSSVDGGVNLICVFENTQDGPFSVDYVLSSDDGLTWGSRGKVYTAAGGHDAGAPQVVLVGGSTLVASFITNENGGGSPTHVDGGNMKTVESMDGGRTWSAPTTVSPVGSHWGGILASDNKFLVMVAVDGSGLISQPWTL